MAPSTRFRMSIDPTANSVTNRKTEMAGQAASIMWYMMIVQPSMVTAWKSVTNAENMLSKFVYPKFRSPSNSGYRVLNRPVEKRDQSSSWMGTVSHVLDLPSADADVPLAIGSHWARYTALPTSGAFSKRTWPKGS